MPESVEATLINLGAQNVGVVVGMLNAELKAHKETLALLKALKSGEAELDRVVITDDGWRYTPAPAEKGAASGSAKK